MITSDWLVSTVLETFPQMMLDFITWKLDCLGCEMSGFCTVADVAREYSLDLPRLLQDFNHSLGLIQEKRSR